MRGGEAERRLQDLQHSRACKLLYCPGSFSKARACCSCLMGMLWALVEITCARPLPLCLTHQRYTAAYFFPALARPVGLSVLQAAPLHLPCDAAQLAPVPSKEHYLVLGPHLSPSPRQLLQTVLTERVFYRNSVFLFFKHKPSSLLEPIRDTQLLCVPELGGGGKKVRESASFPAQCPALGCLVLTVII